MEINSASFGGHVVADLAVKAEIDANWDPPGTYGHTDCSTSSHWTVRANTCKIKGRETLFIMDPSLTFCV